ncbi:hypothetical protein C7S14_8451 [Burkholderia cepacia]|nr:hypothetical protein C7S14_8451 [Burkholderia cepacia]
MTDVTLQGCARSGRDPRTIFQPLVISVHAPGMQGIRAMNAWRRAVFRRVQGAQGTTRAARRDETRSFRGLPTVLP